MKATHPAHLDVEDGLCRLYRRNNEVDTFANDLYLVQEEPIVE